MVVMSSAKVNGSSAMSTKDVIASAHEAEQQAIAAWQRA